MSPAVIERLTYFARDPKRPRADDTVLLSLLGDVLEEAERSSLPGDALAVLYGIATELFARVRNSWPAPIRCDADGRPLWSEQQIAETLGVPVAAVRARIAEIEADGVTLAAADETHVLN